MPWQTTLAENRTLIEITYSGVITPQDLQDALQAAIKLCNESEAAPRILADCRGMTGGHSVVDLYYLIALYEKEKVPHTMKEAILLPALPATLEDVKFYETASLNKGYNVRLFETHDDALAWLQG
jgi:hypothetical protein